MYVMMEKLISRMPAPALPKLTKRFLLRQLGEAFKLLICHNVNPGEWRKIFYRAECIAA